MCSCITLFLTTAHDHNPSWLCNDERKHGRTSVGSQRCGRAHAKFAQLGTCTDGEAIPIRGAIFITVRHQLWEDNAGYLGVTYTCYKAGTSVRISTAIALNFVHYHYAKLGETVAPDTYDLRRLITHEAGHAVAVDHHEATGREHTMGKHLYPGSYLGLSTHDTALACPTFRRLRPSLLTSTDP